MKQPPMTSMQRVLTTLSHKEPDRVPFFLLLTMHGAKELGLSIKEYFSKAEHVVEGQLRMREKYRHDCLYTFFYAAIEVEAFGSKVIYREDGPPNAGAPCIKTANDIETLIAPNVHETPCLKTVLNTIKMLKERVGDEVPIIGVVMSPFSLPVMQMGFDKYIDLMYEQPELFAQLMKINEEFCADWANAQIEAGATAICYFDPVSSPSVIPRDLYLASGFEVAKRTLARIQGPTAIHMASGRCLPIVSDIAQTGTAVLATSGLEDLADVKSACREKMTVMGNLNGIEMCRWTPEQAAAEVKHAIEKGASGGGFILSDNHGEIPFQVSDTVLRSISDAVHTFGNYPLKYQDF